MFSFNACFYSAISSSQHPASYPRAQSNVVLRSQKLFIYHRQALRLKSIAPANISHQSIYKQSAKPTVSMKDEGIMSQENLQLTRQSRNYQYYLRPISNSQMLKWLSARVEDLIQNTTRISVPKFFFY